MTRCKKSKLGKEREIQKGKWDILKALSSKTKKVKDVSESSDEYSSREEEIWLFVKR